MKLIGSYDSYWELLDFFGIYLGFMGFFWDLWDLFQIYGICFRFMGFVSDLWIYGFFGFFRRVYEIFLE